MSLKWLLVSLCVNDHTNGMPNGRCAGIHVDELELETGNLCDRANPICWIDAAKGRVQFGRRRFKIGGHRQWYGNWCWDAVSMERDEAKRLIAYALERGFTVTAQPVPCYLLPVTSSPASYSTVEALVGGDAETERGGE